MFQHPHQLIRRALGGAFELDRAQIHALLYRLCSAHVGTLRSALRRPVQEEAAAHFQAAHIGALERGDWFGSLSQPLLSLPEGADEHLLVLCSAALQLLDRYHYDRRLAFHGQVVDLPVELGGASTRFLVPPRRPFLDLIPQKGRLVRARQDYENDLAWLLGLWWLAVGLEARPVGLRLLDLTGLAAETLERRLAQTGDLKVALASPFGELTFRCQPEPLQATSREGVPYRFQEMDPLHLPSAFKALEETVEACQRHGVDLLCFPELTLDISALGHLRSLLQTRNHRLNPILVVAGSFHMDGPGYRVNRCHVLDGLGNVLFQQDKHTPFRIPAEQVPDLPAELVSVLGIDSRGGVESIRPAGELLLMDSPLGRLAVPICLDYCGEALRSLFVESQANWFLVPAMTPTMEPFLERAASLGTSNRAASFLVNSFWLLRKLCRLSPENLVLGYLPFKGCRRLVGTQLREDLFLFSVRETLTRI